MDWARENVKLAAKDCVHVDSIKSFAEGGASTNNVKSASERGAVENIKVPCRRRCCKKKNIIKLVAEETGQTIKNAASTSASGAIKDFVDPTRMRNKDTVGIDIVKKNLLPIGGLLTIGLYQAYKYFIPEADTSEDEQDEDV